MPGRFPLYTDADVQGPVTGDHDVPPERRAPRRRAADGGARVAPDDEAYARRSDQVLPDEGITYWGQTNVENSLGGKLESNGSDG